MSSNTNNMSGNVPPSNPIPIASARNRNRSFSMSSSTSSSASSTSELPTPPSSSMGSQRISIPSPSNSPILSYFLAQSPAKSATTGSFPFRRSFGPSPVFEEEESDKDIPVAVHARRASVAAASRFSGQPQSGPIPEALQDRGSGLLRRLSLSGGAFNKTDSTQGRGPPSPPPNTAQTRSPRDAPFVNKPRRSATISVDGSKPRRAPSPMGERILKGHFDGFN